jgi:hypothetical protein
VTGGFRSFCDAKNRVKRPRRRFVGF